VERVLAVGWLLLVWLLLWGSTSALAVVSGAAVAVACLAAGRVPVLEVGARPHLGKVLVAVGALAVDLVRSSITVAAAAVTTGGRTRSSVVTVPIQCMSDVVLTIVANRISLTPGTLVLEIDRPGGQLHVYCLPTPDREAAEEERERTRVLAERVVDALGDPGPDGGRGRDDDGRGRG
jgi:multicomponent Na+:H+ antiporter subunit E